MSFIYQAVERIPKKLNGDVVYYSQEFEVAAFLCACGCDHRVMLLVPDGHRVSSDGGMATIRPSVAVCDAPCKSHYFITAGRVEWLPAFSDAMASSVMRSQIARHVDIDAKRRSWRGRARAAIAGMYDRARAAIAKVYKKLKSVFGM